MARPRRRACLEGWTLYPFSRTAVSERDRIRVAPRPAITHGWIGTTSSGWAGTCRSPQAILPIRWWTGKFVTLRIPYPMGFHAKGMDGRIDPKAGWKGRDVVGLRGRATNHIEGGKGTKPKVKFQLRPDALAK